MQVFMAFFLALVFTINPTHAANLKPIELLPDYNHTKYAPKCNDIEKNFVHSQPVLTMLMITTVIAFLINGQPHIGCRMKSRNILSYGVMSYGVCS